MKRQMNCYHFHPHSPHRDKPAFLDVVLNLRKESWVPALDPLKLLGLVRANTAEETDG